MAGGKIREWAVVREELRGYWWVTIVPRELADRLGGLETVAASGAFHEVNQLPDGSLWLRATPTINGFTGGRIRRVFEGLAPVLAAGTIQFLHGAEFRILEGVDAADYR